MLARFFKVDFLVQDSAPSSTISSSLASDLKSSTISLSLASLIILLKIATLLS
jgi:hypothetical protein